MSIDNLQPYELGKNVEELDFFKSKYLDNGGFIRSFFGAWLQKVRFLFKFCISLIVVLT